MNPAQYTWVDGVTALLILVCPVVGLPVMGTPTLSWAAAALVAAVTVRAAFALSPTRAERGLQAVLLFGPVAASASASMKSPWRAVLAMGLAVTAAVLLAYIRRRDRRSAPPTSPSFPPARPAEVMAVSSAVQRRIDRSRGYLMGGIIAVGIAAAFVVTPENGPHVTWAFGLLALTWVTTAAVALMTAVTLDDLLIQYSLMAAVLSAGLVAVKPSVVFIVCCIALSGFAVRMAFLIRRDRRSAPAATPLPAATPTPTPQVHSSRWSVVAAVVAVAFAASRGTRP